MSTDNEKLNSKDLTSKIENENSICEKICKFFTVMSYAILVLLLIFLSLVLFYSIVFIIFDKTKSTESAEGVGIILASFISIIGVFFGFKFNRKQTYNEIVTRERIDWLRDLKNNFSEYLALTSYGYVRYNDIDRVRELYNKIIFNINSVNDIEALEAIKNYDDFVFGKKVEASKEIEKYSDRINCTGAKEEIYYYDIYVSDYEFLKNNMEEKFRAIFKGTWTFIKREAD
ncbi:hypothetical protein [Peptoniphilus sp.]|uniref:hypothetical protein n=1 Tax=Peptoniphilus sp. TaxID=1971214 RepID=UPI003992AAD7